MILIQNATIVNEGKSYRGSVLIEHDKIKKIYESSVPEAIINQVKTIIDASDMWLIPGVIDDQVHFREPGLTHKGDIASESRAAIAGGVTSFMEMPNTNPQTTSIEELDKKFERAAETSFANYSFYLGATNDNLAELKKVNPKEVCGIKVFMGSSTGNMLVDKAKSLQAIFAEIDMLIATHCEKEEIIKKNLEFYKNKFGDNIPVEYHPLIRSEEACYQSSAEAAELADKYGTQLHILHLSTEKEIQLFDSTPLEAKKITGEVCVHHLWFSDEDYKKYGTRIKWNPAVKTKKDRDSLLLQGLLSRKLDVIATDHAPHLLSEKQGGCLQAASGGPLVQHSLIMMLELSEQGKITKEQVVEKMCHNPAILYRINKRGYIREDYFADLVLVKKEKQTISQDNILYKCKWSPLEGESLNYSVNTVFLNGKVAFKDGEVENVRGQRLTFNR